MARAPLLALPPVFGLAFPRELKATVPGGNYDQNLQAAIDAFITLTNNTNAGTAQLTDLQFAQDRVGMLFVSMNQTGVNTTLQNDILANQDEILNDPPSQDQIQSIFVEAQGYGSTVTEETFGNSFVSAPDVLQQALTQIQSSGMFGVELNTNGSLQGLQQTLFALAHSGSQSLKLASCKVGTAHLRRVSAKCPYTILSMAWSVAALFTPPPLDLACALISVYYQLVGFIMC